MLVIGDILIKSTSVLILRPYDFLLLFFIYRIYKKTRSLFSLILHFSIIYYNIAEGTTVSLNNDLFVYLLILRFFAFVLCRTIERSGPRVTGYGVISTRNAQVRPTSRTSSRML